MKAYRGVLIIGVMVTTIMASGCSSSDGDPADMVSGDIAVGDIELAENTDVFPQAEQSIATKLGLTQYVGHIEPLKLGVDGTITTYRFDPAQGPICMRGDEYRTGVRATDSDNLVIFLQGGGVCWSEFCLAVTTAPAGVPAIDILNPELSGNPVADWDVVYLPYCDASLFSGDAEYDDNINNKGKRYHHGLANLTGALEVAKLRFPNPHRILLAGSSGGAYGLLLAGPLVRHYYPDVELIIMADSGIGIARNGEPAYLQGMLDEFNLTRFIPEDCPYCFDNGHMTGLMDYILKNDPLVRVGMYSSWYDSVLATTFLQIPAEQFADALKEQTDRINALHPDRFRRFITDGTQHTSLLGDPSGIIGTDLNTVELPEEAVAALIGDLVIRGMNTTKIGDVSMSQWLTALIDNDQDTWKDTLEKRGPVPRKK